jgi:hypothetical protein
MGRLWLAARAGMAPLAARLLQIRAAEGKRERQMRADGFGRNNSFLFSDFLL